MYWNQDKNLKIIIPIIYARAENLNEWIAFVKWEPNNKYWWSFGEAILLVIDCEKYHS